MPEKTLRKEARAGTGSGWEQADTQKSGYAFLQAYVENKFSGIYTKFYLTVNAFMKTNINIWRYRALIRGCTGLCILAVPQSFDSGIYRMQQHAF